MLEYRFKFKVLFFFKLLFYILILVIIGKGIFFFVFLEKKVNYFKE